MHVQTATTDPELVRTKMLDLGPDAVWVDFESSGRALVTMRIDDSDPERVQAVLAAVDGWQAEGLISGWAS